MWQIFSCLGQQCLTMNLPLRKRVFQYWNKGRERECKTRRKEGGQVEEYQGEKKQETPQNDDKDTLICLIKRNSQEVCHDLRCYITNRLLLNT